MKNTAQCSKCSSVNIFKVEGKKFNQNSNRQMVSAFKFIAITRFICLGCGYTEEWVTNEKELDQLHKRKSKSPENDHSDFV